MTDVVPPTGRLVVIRHGRTEWNASRRFQGQVDVPLDDLGRSQAAAVGSVLAGLGLQPAALVCSDLVRAAETASVIGSALGVSAVPDVRVAGDLPRRVAGVRGHTFLVITNRYEGGALGALDFEGTPVHGFAFHDSLARADLKMVAQLHEACSELIDAFAPDLVHVHGLTRGVFHFMRQQKRRRLPAVLTLHDNLNHEPHAMATPVLQDAERIVAISDFVRQQALRHDPRLKSRLCTVLNALPTVPEPTQPASGQRILALGRLEKHKGFDLAIRAFADVASQFPRGSLTIAGDGPESAQLEQLATQTNMSPRIFFTGWIAPEKVPMLIDEHAVVLVPSRWEEPFGLVALEAAQRARPAIVSRTGGLPEIVVHGQTGLLAENESVQDFALALSKLLSDPVLANRMGQSAKKHAAEHFRFDRLLDGYENVYDEAVSNFGIASSRVGRE